MKMPKIFLCGLIITTFLAIQALSNSSLPMSARGAWAGEIFPTTRDKWLWPFAQNSIWNRPIGAGAQYVPANIQKAQHWLADQEYLYRTKDSDPLRKVYAPGAWTKRCAGNTPSYAPDIPVPDALIVKDATAVPYSTPNNAAAFLMPDGQTLVQLEPLARCVSGGPLYGYHYSEDLNISGPGIGGSHFGSGLSALGGSVRLGELIGNTPIRHAIKVLLWGKKWYYPNPGFRWPASRKDDNPKYGGTNPDLMPGSLLAIPPQKTLKSLDLKTPASKKLFRALQDYGAYIVDDAGWDAHYLAVEHGVLEEFKTAYGYNFEQTYGPFYDDMMKLFQTLHVVNNNGPNSIGGGGKPRGPLAPPIRN
jgi:hypothetical protein